MHNGKTVSHKVIFGNVLRNHPWCKNHLTEEHVLEWLGSFMQHANAPAVLSDKIEFVEIKGGSGKLPSDLHLLNTIGNVSECLNSSKEINQDINIENPKLWDVENAVPLIGVFKNY